MGGSRREFPKNSCGDSGGHSNLIFSLVWPLVRVGGRVRDIQCFMSHESRQTPPPPHRPAAWSRASSSWLALFACWTTCPWTPHDLPIVPLHSQTVSVLLDRSKVSPAPAEGTNSAGNEVTLDESALELLGSLGHAVAIGAEAGEDVDEVSAGTVTLRVR